MSKILNAMITALFLFFMVLPVAAQEGVAESVYGTSDFFVVSTPNSLPITVESSKIITVEIESNPEIIIFNVEADVGAASTDLSVSGLTPVTDYYKYEDGFGNLTVVSTDENGVLRYTQDLTTEHIVFIKPNPSTVYIPGNTTVGTWDSVNRVYTLTQDINE
ncbi:MAG: hypothetical protein D3923_15090, partial [Candidatus Electrothrix sp. AR3]|nr:hypothetical protein [Candidatus Electrothrix sp. AR3]